MCVTTLFRSIILTGCQKMKNYSLQKKGLLFLLENLEIQGILLNL